MPRGPNKTVASVALETFILRGKSVNIRSASLTLDWWRPSDIPRPEEKARLLAALEAYDGFPEGTEAIVVTHYSHSSPKDPLKHFTVRVLGAKDKYLTTAHLHFDGETITGENEREEDDDDDGQDDDGISVASSHTATTTERHEYETTSDHVESDDECDSDQDSTQVDGNGSEHSQDENERRSNPFASALDW